MLEATRLANPPKPKRKIGSIVLMTAMALAFSYIILKDLVLPSWVMMAAVVAGGMCLFGAGINKPEVIIYVLVAYLPFSKVLAGDFGGLAMALNLTNLLMLFIFFVWMSGKFSAGEPLWLSTPLNLPIILFTLAGCISVIRGNYFGSDYLWLAIVEFKRWITPILLYFLVLNTVKDRGTIRNVVTIIIIVSTVVGLMAIYDYIEVGDVSLEKARIGGIAGHSNSLAAFFNYYVFLPIGFFLLNTHRAQYWLLWVPFLIQFRGIMVTFSRGGYIAFAFGLYALAFFRHKALFIILLLAACLSLLNPILLPAGIRYRMSQTFTKPVSYADAVTSPNQTGEALDGSARGRLEIWKGALRMIKEQPVFGVGYGLFFPLIRYYWAGGFSIDAHNTYLIIAAEMGVPALLIFLFIILIVTWHTYALYRSTKDLFTKGLALGFLGGLFGLMMSNMFGSRLDSQEVSSYFWILSALIMRLRILEAKEGNSTLALRRSKKLDAVWTSTAEIHGAA